MATKKPVVIETTLADLWSQFQTGDTLDVNGAVTINDAGGDFDVRIEGDTATVLFVTDASLDSVFIGTTSTGAIAAFRPTNVVINENNGDIDFRVEGDTAVALFICDAGLDAVQIGAAAAGTIADFRSTAIVFNETGNDQDFRVEGDTSPQLFVCDAGTNTVKVGLTNAGELMNLTATVAEFNNIGSDIDFRVSGSILGSPSAFVIDAGLGAVRFGTIVDGDIFDARATGWVVNEGGANFDTRIEGDTLTHMIYTDGDASSENIVLLGASLPAFNSMDRGLFIGNMTTAPTGNPTAGIYAWVDGDTFKIQNPSGTVKDLFTGGGADKLGLIGTATKTGTYTAVVGDLVRNDTSGGAFTVTMPAAPAAGDVVGVMLMAGTATLTIARAGSQVFVGPGEASTTSILVNDTGACLLFMYSATNEWAIVADSRNHDPILEIYIADGTSTPPVGYKTVTVHAVGGGAGGGAGRKGTGATNKYGGGGGGGGEYRSSTLTAATVGTSGVTVTVGFGGAAGAFAGTNSTDGGNGGDGTASSFGSHVVANPGIKGLGGTTAAGSGGAGGSGGTGTTAVSGGAGGNGGGAAAGTSGGPVTGQLAGAGGGGGWGYNTASAVNLGGFGGTSAGQGGSWGSAGIVDGYSGGPGGVHFTADSAAILGGGGGGGGSSIATAPAHSGIIVGNGGQGGKYGGGGGGGGGAIDGTSSFMGGQAGARGIVLVAYKFR